MSRKSPDRLRFAVCAASLILAVAVASPVSAQDPDRNWMREYVQLRVLARNQQAVGNAPAGRAAGATAELRRPRIIGGTPAGATDNPYQVALLTKSDSNNATAQFCGGTLMRPNLVVTAAHCSDFVQPSQVQVLTGTQKLDGTGVRRDVSRIVIHPDWSANTFNNDVAVWQLSTAAPASGPAPGRGPTLAKRDGRAGDTLLVTGWGLTSENGSPSVDLRRLEVPLVDRTDCNDANSYNGKITDRMLCAGVAGGGRDSCQGDSGGPLTGGADRSVLTGIVSWGTGCARPNLFGIYTRVSNPAVRNFIEKQIRAGQ
jgi:trypsin